MPVSQTQTVSLLWFVQINLEKKSVEKYKKLLLLSGPLVS